MICRIFSSKHEEVDALKNKFQTQIKGLEKLHDEMRETQKKMAIEQEFFEQQQQQFNQVYCAICMYIISSYLSYLCASPSHLLV